MLAETFGARQSFRGVPLAAVVLGASVARGVRNGAKSPRLGEFWEPRNRDVVVSGFRGAVRQWRHSGNRRTEAWEADTPSVGRDRTGATAEDCHLSRDRKSREHVPFPKEAP